MKNIKLFHSYNYLNEKFIHDNKNIYDKHNKLICSLQNIPGNSELYTIQIQRILKKKIFSKKNNNKSFYTKHNIKVFLLVKYHILQNYLKQNKCIPELNVLTKIILSNIRINKNEYLHNMICINKTFNKKIVLINNITNDFNFFCLNDYYLDILSNTIIEKQHIKLKKYTVNGCIIYYDLLKCLVDELLTIKNTIFIGNDKQCNQFTNIVNIVNIDTDTMYDTIILLDTLIDISKLKFSKIIICVNKTSNIKVNDVIFLFDKFFKVNLYKYELTNKLIYNMINTCIFRNYSQKLIKMNDVVIQDNNYINVKRFRIESTQLINTLCSICFINTINIETICDHYFCSICINKLLNNNKMVCPYCRLNININTLTYLVKSKNDIISEKSNINSKYKYLIKKSMKHDISIISNNDPNINGLKKLYKFMDINLNIYTINNINLITNNNIYLLDKKDTYDINHISNCLIQNCVIKNRLNLINLS